MPMPSGRPIPKTLSFLLLSVALGLALPFAARAQACSEALEQADDLYVRAAFDEAITLLTDCLENNQLSGEDRAKAYRLVGLSYIGKRQMEEASLAASELMAIQPDYQPDPVNDPPSWQRLVDEAEPAETTTPDPAPSDPVRAAPPPQQDPITSPPTSPSLGALFVQLHLNSSAIIDEDEDTFSGGGFKLGFPLTPALIAFGGLTVALVQPEEDLLVDANFRLTMLNLGAQFNIGASRRSFVPYFVAAYTRQSLSVDVDDVDAATGNAFTAGAGAMYFFTPPPSIGLGLDLTFGGLKNDDLGEGSTGAARLSLGLSWFPLR